MHPVFDSLSFHSIQTLVQVLATTKSGDLDFARSKHQATADGFEAALEFLSETKLVQVKSNAVVRTTLFAKLANKPFDDDDFLRSYLIELTLNSRGAIAGEVHSYLSRFRVSGNALEYSPTTRRRLSESGVRNLLIEFGMVEYDDARKLYSISDRYSHHLANQPQPSRCTPKELDYVLNKRKAVGEAAELEILDYEKGRLSEFPELLENLQHTAAIDAGAGYDIRSYETEQGGDEPIPRYIEVKAVSLTDFKFHWSKNEIDKAKQSGRQYYLYLLPVVSHNVFDIAGLEIISNPYCKVFMNDEDWNKQEEHYSLWKKT